MTIEDRYGPYGFGQDRKTYNRSKVEWNKVDWGKLQNDCFMRNHLRFPSSARKFDDARKTIRLGYRNETRIPEVRQWHEFNATRRTALVVRAWRGFAYTDESMYYLRSLITEGALRTGGEYQVILLIDMKDYDKNIFASPEHYQQGFRDAKIPPELQSIAILWDDRFLESWYPKIEEHR